MSPAKPSQSSPRSPPSCSPPSPNRPPWAIAVHGGAGNISRNIDAAAHRAALRKATRAGAHILASVNSSADDADASSATVRAVVAAVTCMEECPLFNAGRGSVLTRDGTVEMEASVMAGGIYGGMDNADASSHNPSPPPSRQRGDDAEHVREDGETRARRRRRREHDPRARRWGGCCGVATTRNPVQLAHVIMRHVPHGLIGFDAADALAREYALEQAAPEWFHTERRRKQLHAALSAAGQQPVLDHSGGYTEARTPHSSPLSSSSYESPTQLSSASSTLSAAASSSVPASSVTDGAPNVAPDEQGTVGAVAIDAAGHVAVATSTGGLTAKYAGRIGDTPVVGAGSYACDRAGVALSGTGNGDAFLLHGAAIRVATLMESAGAHCSLDDALARVVYGDFDDGDGGFIAIDARDASVHFCYRSTGMFRAWYDAHTHSPLACVWDESPEGDPAPGGGGGGGVDSAWQR